MYMHNHRRLAVLLLVFATTVPLMALPLQDLIAQALSKSTSMQDLEYSKQKTLLTIGLNQVEDELGIAIAATNIEAEYDATTNAYKLYKSSLRSQPHPYLWLYCRQPEVFTQSSDRSAGSQYL